MTTGSAERRGDFRVLYLACDDRSGSTVTERCLAALPSVCSLGEVHNLPAYVHGDRTFFNPPYELRCSCGAPVADCAFWGAVNGELATPLASLRLRVDFPRRTGLPDLLDRARWRAEEWAKGSGGGGAVGGAAWHHLMGYAGLARNYWALYAAAARVSGRRVVVDSSKWPVRLNYLARHDRDRLSALLMYRSPFAVVHSKMRHTTVDAVTAARRWLSFAEQMECIAARLPASQVFRLFYEAFCAAPETSLTRIARGLGLDDTVEVDAPMDVTQLHHIGGSPSKFDATRTRIEVDESWRTDMAGADRAVVEEVAGAYWRRLCEQHGQPTLAS